MLNIGTRIVLNRIDQHICYIFYVYIVVKNRTTFLILQNHQVLKTTHLLSTYEYEAETGASCHTLFSSGSEYLH